MEADYECVNCIVYIRLEYIRATEIGKEFHHRAIPTLHSVKEKKVVIGVLSQNRGFAIKYSTQAGGWLPSLILEEKPANIQVVLLDS
jgi:hypothetical protein